ncbi:MAG: SMC-Scp complex subunit ScpB [Patescibacteria group bacterium]|nr:SMC-Scp complex subunit ScpB [Patescibacteria group bacterium]
MEDNNRSKVEAILFVAGDPVGVPKLAKFLKLSVFDLNNIIEELEEFYEQQYSGLQVIYKKNTIQLVSRSEYGELVAKFLKKSFNEPLSKASLEVLSVIAYRGPVTRAQIEHIRGVNCSFTIRNLAIRGLVDRSDNSADSRSYLYEASCDFIKSIGLKSLKDLPDYDNLHIQEDVIKADKVEKKKNE